MLCLVFVDEREGIKSIGLLPPPPAQLRSDVPVIPRLYYVPLRLCWSSILYINDCLSFIIAMVETCLFFGYHTDNSLLIALGAMGRLKQLGKNSVQLKFVDNTICP